jgi:hypothetical protein
VFPQYLEKMQNLKGVSHMSLSKLDHFQVCARYDQIFDTMETIEDLEERVDLALESTASLFLVEFTELVEFFETYGIPWNYPIRGL